MYPESQVQSVCAILAAAELEPEGHVRHSAIPVALLYVPAGHAAQVPCFVRAYPCAHSQIPVPRHRPWPLQPCRLHVNEQFSPAKPRRHNSQFVPRNCGRHAHLPLWHLPRFSAPPQSGAVRTRVSDQTCWHQVLCSRLSRISTLVSQAVRTRRHAHWRLRRCPVIRSKRRDATCGVSAALVCKMPKRARRTHPST